MKPKKNSSSINNDHQAENTPVIVSKTQLKAQADALQDLGVKLTTLPKDRLKKLNLPEKLMDAISESKRITANGAIRRHRQYLGGLMREIDVTHIVEQLEKWDGKNKAENAYFHQLERWRDRLIAEEPALAAFIEQYPQVDTQPLRALIRNARKEQSENKPPKSSRELFKLLREVTAPDTPSINEVLEDEDEQD
jgi:ribosome-associated protein